MKPSRLIPLAAVAVLLAACEGDAPQEGEVTGEVLQGTISDEMLELEQVRSQGPLAEPTGTGSATPSSTAAQEPESEAGDESEVDGVEEPQPAEPQPDE